jgi:hypothetical protein
LTTIRATYTDSAKFWPYADLLEDDVKVVNAYAKEHKNDIKTKKFTAAQKGAKAARDDLQKFVRGNEDLDKVRTNGAFFGTYPVMFKNKALLTEEEVNGMLAKMDKKNPAHATVKALAAAIKKVKEEDRKEFNKKLNELINTAATFSRESVTLDAEVGALLKDMSKDKDATKDQKKSAKAAMTPVEHRANLRKVSEALSTLASKSNEVENQKLNEDEKDADKDGKEAAGGSAGAIIGAIVGVLVVVGGVAYCKCNKKFCFEDKEDAAEGGEADKNVYKQEVKSKNSHKRHAKESLMPAFKVAEDQA